MAGQLQQESFDTSGLPDGWTSININGSKEWHYGYNGVMPHSGPTIESEFSAGAALFINSEKSSPHQERISLKAPPVELSEAESARI